MLTSNNSNSLILDKAALDMDGKENNAGVGRGVSRFCRFVDLSRVANRDFGFILLIVTAPKLSST